MADVVLNNISKRFGDTEAVRNLSMTIPDGAFVVLLGPTGAGKTTTLRLISGLETLDTGSVRIAGDSTWKHPSVPPWLRSLAVRASSSAIACRFRSAPDSSSPSG